MKLRTPPIVEAVVDIDCDMPPSFNMTEVEKPAIAAMKQYYPKFRTVHMEQHRIERKGDASPPVHTTNRAIQAFQFLHDDEKQIVQFRSRGFSFNRLAPYTTLGDYLPEIERTWRLFLSIALPVQIRALRLRYINRIQLPLSEKGVLLEEYIKGTPHPEDENLELAGFFNQYTAVDKKTGHEIIVVTTPESREGGNVPLILDITVASSGKASPDDWARIIAKIQELRDLKNRIFYRTLTQKCLNQFQ